MLMLRGRFGLVLGAALYAVSWGFGIDEGYALAVGLVLAVVAAGCYVRVGAGALRFVRRAGRGEHVEGADLPVRIEIVAENGVAPFGATLLDSLPGGADQRVGLRRKGDRLSGDVRAAWPSARPLPPRRRAPGDRGPVRVGPRGAPPRRRRGDARVPARVRPRPPVLRRRRARRLGRRLLLSRTSGYDLHSVRDYVQGESLRRVDWKSTAKRGKLMVRELEDSPRDEAAVVLDCEGGLDVAAAPDSSFEMQVRVAASILHRLGQTGHRSALVYDDRAHGEDAAGVAGRRLARGARPAGGRAPRRPPRAADDPRRRTRRPRRAAPVPRHREPDAAPRRPARGDAVRARRRGRGVGRRRAPGAASVPSPARPDGVALRLARAGVPIARVRRGDDVRAALAGGVREAAPDATPPAAVPA